MSNPLQRILPLATAIMVACHVALPCQAAGEGDVSIKIFALKYADCDAMVGILRTLSHGELTTAIDSRTNSLILRGDSESLEVASSILVELDREVVRKDGKSDLKADRPSGKVKRDAQAGRVLAPANGVVREVVADGNHVRRGEVVVVLELSSPAKGDVDRAQRQAARSHTLRELETSMRAVEGELRLAEMKIELSHRSEEMSKAEGILQMKLFEMELANAEAMAEVLQARAEALEAQAKDGRRPMDEFMMGRAEAMNARRQVEVVREKLKLHQEHQVPLQRLQHETEIVASEAEVQRMRQELKTLSENLKAERAAVEVEQAQNRDLAKRTKQRTLRVLAGRDGVVRHVASLEEGAKVRAKQPLLTIE